jgi:methionyl-tRNA formyltransferase
VTDYPYATGDLIEAPNTYFYSQYGGRAFVTAWRDDRQRVRTNLPASIAPQPAAQGVDTASRDSVDLLELALGGDTTLAEAFAKKFEIHKRVHDGYDDEFRALDKSARQSLPLYLRAADLFAGLYEDSGALRHLNVYLKCLDTLCSLSDDLSADLTARLAWHLEQEATFIGALMTTRKIAS